ncbi:hypothetical protein [Streptomyces tendae]|uniref:hypothetical protein n=1 Tax=Streptomyces tendae TaxID=1932 RepID=UPI003D7255F4
MEQHELVDEQRHSVQSAVRAGSDLLDGGRVERADVDAGGADLVGEVAQPAARFEVPVDAPAGVLDDDVGHDAGLVEILVADRHVPGRGLDLEAGEGGAQGVSDDRVEEAGVLEGLVVGHEDEQLVVADLERLVVPVGDGGAHGPRRPGGRRPPGRGTRLSGGRRGE